METTSSYKKPFLCGIFIGLFFTVICTGIILFALSKEHIIIFQKNSTEDICETPACVTGASSLLQWMDPSVDPCDNFYKFVCGNYYNTTDIEYPSDTVNNFDLVSKTVSKKLRFDIERNITEKDPKAFKLLQSYYNICVDTEKVEKSSENEFRSILKELGGWPVLDGDSWDESSFDWKKTVYKLHNMGYTMINLVDFTIDVDLKNNSRRIIYLNQPKLGLLQQILTHFWRSDVVVKNYFKFMIDFAELFGVSREQANLELNETLNFEIKLLQVYAQENYNLTNLQELQTKYPNFTWMEFFNELLDHHEQVELSDEIVVLSPLYLESFERLISEVPNRVLANYLMWNVAIQSTEYLSERVRNVVNNYQKSFGLFLSNQTRQETCIDKLKPNLPTALKALYVRKNFNNEEAKKNFPKMIEDLKKSFKNLLIKNEWMDEKTKKAALEKIDYMGTVVAYPNEYLDDKKLDSYYHNLTINSSDSYLKSQLSINLFDRAYKYENFRKPYNRSSWIHFKWFDTPVNIWRKNIMEITAPYLQRNFFSQDRPEYMNYGSFGMIIGHELTHGFDIIGGFFDKQGNYVDWWDQESRKELNIRAKCMAKQYSNYTVQEIDTKINGFLTLNENIADNGGMKQAYYAYNEWEKQKNKVEPRLPGLKYTSQQMFWISAANFFCAKYHPEYLRILMLTDSHSPVEFRVNGALTNIPEFSKDFKCPSNSSMNSPKKCVVW